MRQRHGYPDEDDDMNSEMVERVARAIFSSWRKQMDEDGHAGRGPMSFDELDGGEHGFGIIAARSAIEAMRVPTERMIEAARSQEGQQTYVDVWRVMCKEALR